MTSRMMLALVLATFAGTTAAAAPEVEQTSCAITQFSERIEVERYFKGFAYEGMLAECQLSKTNKSHIEAYIGGHSATFTKNMHEISEQCGTSEAEVAMLSFAYAGGMRRAGGMAIWRLIEEDEKAFTCAAILHIIKSKME